VQITVRETQSVKTLLTCRKSCKLLSTRIPCSVVQVVTLLKGVTSSLFPQSLLLCISDRYLSINPTADVVYAYKMGYSSQGTPYFTLAGKSLNKFAGTSVPTVTSLNGQPGTGIVSISSSNLNFVGA
jgi:hypothetical protein